MPQQAGSLEFNMEEHKQEDSTGARIDVLSRTIIALVIGILLGAIIGQMGLNALQEKLSTLIRGFIWLIILFALLTFWIVQNKESILKRLFRVSDTDLGELNNVAQSLLFNTIEKDYPAARRDLTVLFRRASAWVAWMNFRRWIVVVFQSLFVGLGGLLGTVMLYNQNKLLVQQNQLLNQQNIRLDQQTYLQEAERRSSLVFLMGNILDAVNQELKEDVGIKGVRDITPQLIGRIIALSNSLRPYRYLGNDSLVLRELSPERGFLLFSIASSEIDQRSLRKIYRSADFSFSDLKGAVLSGEFLAGINLTGADLNHAQLDEADLSGARLSEAELTEAVLARANLRDARLRNANLYKTYFESADLRHANLSGANMQYANLAGANLENTHMSYTDMFRANLSGATLVNTTLNQSILDSAVVSAFGWLDSLQTNPDTSLGTRYLTNRYHIDSVETKFGWFYLVLPKTVSESNK